MAGPSLLDQLAFSAWMTLLYAVFALPLYGVWRVMRRV